MSAGRRRKTTERRPTAAEEITHEPGNDGAIGEKVREEGRKGLQKIDGAIASLGGASADGKGGFSSHTGG